MSKEVYDVIAKVISQKGKCSAGHKVGDEFIIGTKTPPGMCSSGFCSIFPFAQVLQYGGSFPFVKDSVDSIKVACTDPNFPLVFELKRKLLNDKSER